MATAERPKLMTAEEFGKRPDPGYPEELVRGRIVPGKYADLRHGWVCSQAAWRFGEHLEKRDLGHLVGLSGLLTERDPDTVRAVDLSFYGYDRFPRGLPPEGYGPGMPDWAVEVVSAFDRWPDVLAKVAEFLNAGVRLVVVLDPDSQTAHVFGADDAPRMLGAEDELTLPGVLEGFRIRVGRFFE
jgi:Uma2 family endonuclease